MRSDFEEALEKGASPSSAADRVIAGVDLSDEDDGPVSILALAVLLLDAGCNDHGILGLALSIVERGDGLQRWRTAGSEMLSERKTVYGNLAARLTASRDAATGIKADKTMPAMKNNPKSSKRRTFKEGNIFAVPLKDGGFAAGVVARKLTGHGFLGYFYGPHRNSLDDIWAPPTGSLGDPILIGECSDLGLLNGSWTVVGHIENWNKEEWPIPAFGHIDAVDGGGWIREYADDGRFTALANYRVTPEEARALPEDGSWGYVALERRLSILLADDHD